MKEGNIVKSLKGHDTGRIYMVLGVLNDNFVLVVDGKYRCLDNPKQKRVKHLALVSVGDLPLDMSDSAIRKLCKI